MEIVTLSLIECLASEVMLLPISSMYAPNLAAVHRQI